MTKWQLPQGVEYPIHIHRISGAGVGQWIKQTVYNNEELEAFNGINSLTKQPKQ